MSETYTEDFLVYTSIIVGYSLNKDKFIKFIKKILALESAKEYEIYNTNHLSKVNEILFRDNIIFHFNGEKSVLGVKIKDFEKDSDGVNLKYFNELYTLQSKIDAVISKLELHSLIKEECKIHMMIYD